MNVIGIDSSGRHGGVTLIKDGEIAAYMPSDGDRSFSRSIIPFIDSCIQKAGLESKDVDIYGVGVGPGSFTGVRIGIATRMGLTLTSGKPLLGVSTLEAMAEGYRLSGVTGGIIMPLIDAGRGLFYHARFRIEAGGIERLTDDAMDDGSVIMASCGAGTTALGDRSALEETELGRELLAKEADIFDISGISIAAGVAGRAEYLYKNKREANPFSPKPNYIHRGPAARS